jgi:hypothetical protein
MYWAGSILSASVDVKEYFREIVKTNWGHACTIFWTPCGLSSVTDSPLSDRVKGRKTRVLADGIVCPTLVKRPIRS